MTPQELADPIWRICNLYHIVDKSGQLVQFRPNEIQMDFLTNMGYRNLILKARQMGFSTLIQIAILDQCIFLPNVHAGIIAQDDPTRFERDRNGFRPAFRRKDEFRRILITWEDQRSRFLRKS
jgi:hypothetical protein